MDTMRILLLLLALAAAACAQDKVDLGVVHQIRTEAFDNSKVMDTLRQMSDEYGPRLTGSPEVREAGDWAVKTLEGYGLSNVHQEKWGPFGRTWSAREYWVEMNAPRYAQLDTAPLAWSKGTNGPVSGDIIYAPLGGPRRVLDPKRYLAQIEAWEKQYKGMLRGKIVLITSEAKLEPLDKPQFVRYSDAQLADMARAPEPHALEKVDIEHIDVPDEMHAAFEYIFSLPSHVQDQFFDARDAARSGLNQFLLDEGALAVITTDQRVHTGIVAAQQGGSYDVKYPLAPPTFAVTAEQYNRLARLAENHVPEKITVDLKVDTNDTPMDSFNIIGEIPGGEKKDEVIMIGGHFDSWQAATGATDNGAGSAVMMEVMRVLKALNLKMDRTVRIGLWTGEEQGLLGSKAYVKAHFGDPDTMKITDEQAKLSGYFNLDNGSGKIRGVYLQGNDAMRPVFEQWLAPFQDLGVSTITIRDTGGTDHLSFDAVGLPGFQFIQDPLDYETITHHTNMDTFDHAQAGDLMQAVAVIASVVYDAANRPEMLPRKPLPQATR
jgi:carboxypeptidase Q